MGPLEREGGILVTIQIIDFIFSLAFFLFFPFLVLKASSLLLWAASVLLDLPKDNSLITHLGYALNY